MLYSSIQAARLMVDGHCGKVKRVYRQSAALLLLLSCARGPCCDFARCEIHRDAADIAIEWFWPRCERQRIRVGKSRNSTSGQALASRRLHRGRSLEASWGAAHRLKLHELMLDVARLASWLRRDATRRGVRQTSSKQQERSVDTKGRDLVVILAIPLAPL